MKETKWEDTSVA